MNRWKKIIDGAWYVWPRFPGAVFHLSCSALAMLTFLYGIVCIIQKHLLR